MKSNLLTITVPSVTGTAGYRSITVINGDGRKLPVDNLLYINDPLSFSIDKVVPTTITEGQTKVTLRIRGSGFVSNPNGTEETKLKVYIPGVINKTEGAIDNEGQLVIVRSPQEIMIVSPLIYGSGPGVPNGYRTVTVRNGNGQKLDGERLLYVNAKPPFSLRMSLRYSSTITAYFDHAIRGWFYDKDTNLTVMSYQGKTGVDYNGHPAYDYRTVGQLTERNRGKGDVDVLAAADGEVIYAAGGGKTGCNCNVDNCSIWGALTIQHAEGYMTCYLHLSNNGVVKKGAKVTKGQFVGVAGNVAPPGGSKGPHLHFQVIKDGKPVDPYGWQGNGTDPYPFAKNVWLWDSSVPKQAALASISTSGNTGASIVGSISTTSTTNSRRQANENNDEGYTISDSLDIAFTILPSPEDIPVQDEPEPVEPEQTADMENVSETSNVEGDMTPSPANAPGNSAIYVVALYVDNMGSPPLWLQKNGNDWAAWSGDIAALQPWLEGIQLMPEEQVDVVQGLAGLQGDFQVYVGYRNIEGGITFNVEPLIFSIQ